jgi:hypothetical protein
MKLFKWISGRQSETSYQKLCFLYVRVGKWGFDGYLLKYQPHTRLKHHTDPVKGKHWRLNITLWGMCTFLCNKEILRVGEFIHLFRPDINPHGLIVFKKTVKLSFGLAKFD